VGLGRIFALPPAFVALLVEAFVESDALVGADSEIGGSGGKLIWAAAVASAALKYCEHDTNELVDDLQWIDNFDRLWCRNAWCVLLVFERPRRRQAHWHLPFEWRS
jgi:hypothetical protein